ncbi:MAG: hypothetical protein IJZ76_04735 [Lachnospiraceae bacterium]|nr:hypothetical protein [Lachnospiraceae bacterium]
MDKYEYRIRAEEINDLIEKKQYVEAVKIADTIDWRRVRSVVMLCKVSELYKMNRRYEDSKEILLMAYELQNKSRKIVYSLCELSIKLEETVQAVEYYKEFIKIAPRDTGRFILQYRLYEAQDVSLEERIAVLEEYKKRDYREKWAYELAYLYHRIGLATRCVEECDELILWFGEGKYVIKAMELKMLHAPLSPEQQEVYNARFMVPVMEQAEQVQEEAVAEEVEPSLSIEIKSVDATRAKTAEIPSKKVAEEASVQEEAPVSYETYEPEAYETAAYEPEMYEPENYEAESYPAEEVLSEDITYAQEEKPVEDEDADMKIVNSADDFDIQVKTIDVGDEYSTINLQEELAKNLAEMLAQEDMEALDATRALPIESIFEATSQGLNVENIENLQLQDEVVNEVINLEDTKKVPEIEEIAEVEEEEIPEIEEIAEVEEEVEIPETEEIAEVEEVEEIPETEEIAEVEEVEEIPEVEEVAEVEEEAEEIPETEEVAEVAEVEEIPETEEITEIEEEVPVAEEIPEVEPIVFGQNQPLPDAVLQALQSVAMEAAKEAAKQAAQEAAKQAAQEAAYATAEVIKEMKPEPALEEKVQPATEVIEEEPQEMVEKQITGQLSFSDIMAEWEETKKANEEKHLQEMKQRVMEQTGPLLSDFDAAARASVQSDLDMINPTLDVFSDTEDLATEVETALMEEEVAENPAEEAVAEEIPETPIEEEIVEEIPEISVAEEIPEVPETVEVIPEVPVNDIAMMAAMKAAQEAAEKSKAEAPSEDVEDRPSSFSTEEINGLEDKLMGALSQQHYDTANIQAAVLESEMASVKEEPKQEEKQPEIKQPAGPRTLTLDEKTLFGCIAPNKPLQEKVTEVLDSISLLPYTGNVVITGENGIDKRKIAKNIVLHLSKVNPAFSGKTQISTCEEFNGKDIFAIVSQLANGALIIENAGDMSGDLCNKLIKAGNEIANGGIVYILIDTKSGIERLSRTYAKANEYFNLHMDINALDNDGLVEFGKNFAKEKEYSIDDMGVLALYNRIEERQTNEHAVTVDEVKEIVLQAIEKSEKKNLSHFMDVIFAKRYDKEDMIVLREKDFMND